MMNAQALPSLEDAKIKGLPSSAFYIADFISAAEEQTLQAKIAAAPKPRWKQLAKRRLQVWPSDLSPKNTLLEAPLPTWLAEPIIPRMLSLSNNAITKGSHVFQNSPHGTPNHCLINEYYPGQGIMPHKDGAAYHPVVCTVSLGGSLCLDIYGTNDDGITESEPTWKILQEPRSLLVITDEIYTDFLHGIAEITEDSNLSEVTVSNWNLLRSTDFIANGRSDRQVRTSLTYRDVIKVSKLGVKLDIFGKR